MAVEVAPRRFTVAEYAALAAAGVLAAGERVELLDGEILSMNPIGPAHAAVVRRLTLRLAQQVGEQALVSVQNPLVLNDQTELQPDVALLRPRPDAYAERHPRAADALLVVEVADTTVLYDSTRKAAAYARSGIGELWVVDLPHAVVRQYGEPHADGYQRVAELHTGAVLRASRLPVQIAVDELIIRPPAG